MEPAIRVENLGKRYYVSQNRDTVRYKTFRESLTNAFLSPFRRFTQAGDSGPIDEFWALKDVSFDIQPGEVVGIIGRNGAGKSTLLKILSRITKPTTGRIEINGRVGSLLEVGTGFHPELTGRENIYLNGSILGMSRAEIKAKFDEIVAFAEVEQFLDTPVKRYSSGMYVRLAFAVAAHLEPEILIVDEVLAVGDAQFQKKCLGKMKDVAKHGRTVLFVSHNLAAVRTLCNRGVVLKAGRIDLASTASDAVDHYFSMDSTLRGEANWEPAIAPRGNGVSLSSAWLSDLSGCRKFAFDFRESVVINLEYILSESLHSVRMGIIVKHSDGVVVFGSSDHDSSAPQIKNAGRYVCRCCIPGHTLNSGSFTLTVGSDQPSRGMLFLIEECLQFEILDSVGHGPNLERPPGVARPAVRWEAIA